ncbi:hypothetical protein ACFE04_023305 [Oxalis oulophora]
MSEDYDSDSCMEHATAVAAAAYAINSLDESKKTGEPAQPSLVRFRSKTDDAIITDHEPVKESPGEFDKYDLISDGISEDNYATTEDEPEPESPIAPPPPIMKRPTIRIPSRKSVIDDGEMPEKSVARVPSFKRTSSFPSKRFDDVGSFKSEIEKRPPTIKPLKPRTRHGMVQNEETEADAWEKAELAKVNERYEKVKTTIQKWEDKQKEEAKTKLLLREQSELEQTRVKARQRYNITIETTNKIAGGAKAQAEERRRNEEMKIFQFDFPSCLPRSSFSFLKLSTSQIRATVIEKPNKR